jgi:hypothetical protein
MQANLRGRVREGSGNYWTPLGATFVHPALVRCAIEYRPITGQTGPSFRNGLSSRSRACPMGNSLAYAGERRTRSIAGSDGS